MSNQESGVDLSFDILEFEKEIDKLLTGEEGGFHQLKWKAPSESPPQNANMLSSSSRTQLKQQLMRQQMQQQEAREREFKGGMNLHQQNIQIQQQQNQQLLQQQFQRLNQQFCQQQQHGQQQPTLPHIQLHVQQQQNQHQQYFQHPLQQYHSQNVQHQDLAQQQIQQIQPQPAIPQQSSLPSNPSQHLNPPQMEVNLNHQIEQSNNAQQQRFQPEGHEDPEDHLNNQSSRNCAISPNSFLQIQSRLENPTLYHVVQSQKRLLRQQQPESPEKDVPAVAESTPMMPFLASHAVPTGQPDVQVTYSDPGEDRRTGAFVATKGLRGYTTGRAPLPARVGGSTPYARSSSAKRVSNIPSIPSYASSGISPSAASLTSDASEVDEVIEEILSLEEGLEAGAELTKSESQASVQQSQSDSVPGTICHLLELNGLMGTKTSSTSCPPDLPQVKAEPKSTRDPQVTAFMKDRQKKDNHNMIERRRRFHINDRIRDLSQLLPKNNEPYHEIVRDIRHNKGQILKASVDYIRRLKSDLDASKEGEDKRRALEQQNRQLLLRIQELENQLRMNGITIEETSFDSNLLFPTIAKSDVMSPTSTSISPTTSPYTPLQTTSPFTPTPTTSPPLNPVAGNFTTTTCSSGSDLTDLTFGEDTSITSAETTNILNDLGVGDSGDVKKVKCPGTHLPDFLFEELFMEDFSSGAFAFNLMEDESLAAYTGDPMFSSPQVSSPGSSRNSFEGALTPDSMDVVS